MKCYLVPEHSLREFMADAYKYNAIKWGGLFDEWAKAVDVLMNTMYDDEDYETFREERGYFEHAEPNVFDFFKWKAEKTMKYLEETKGTVEK